MPKRRGSEWAVLLTLSLGFFMTLLDLTIVNIAIPDLRRSLHVSLAEIGWVINAYIIVLAVLMITAGRLGDLRGRRTLFLSGVAVFSLASAASGLSQNVAELIAARTVQGLGAAMLLPQTMAIIIAIFPGHRRGAALGVWGSVAGLATIAGPHRGRHAGDLARLAMDLLRQHPGRRPRPAARRADHPRGADRPPPAARPARGAHRQRVPGRDQLRPGRGAELPLGDRLVVSSASRSSWWRASC